MKYPYGDTLTLVKRTPTGRDSDGNATFTETSRTLRGVPVWPRNSSELVQGQDVAIAGVHALLPAGTAVTAKDRVVWAGDSYEVDGPPAAYKSPFTGWTPGVLVTLTLVAG